MSADFRLLICPRPLQITIEIKPNRLLGANGAVPRLETASGGYAIRASRVHGWWAMEACTRRMKALDELIAKHVYGIFEQIDTLSGLVVLTSDIRLRVRNG